MSKRGLRAVIIAAVVGLGLWAVAISLVAARESVSICHFAGHQGDFVLQNQDPHGEHRLCAREGGNDLRVGTRRACESHRSGPNLDFPATTCDALP